jgi:F-type H+-transporting ATPase subunit a
LVEAQAAEGAVEGGTHLPNPMHQFEIKRFIPIELFGFDASFTNSALFMVIAATLITLFTLYAMRSRSMVPSRLQSVAELSYEFVANMVRDNVGTDGMKYFPFVFTLFMFVLALNLLGMVPYFFTVTSHIIVTFFCARRLYLRRCHADWLH